MISAVYNTIIDAPLPWRAGAPSNVWVRWGYRGVESCFKRGRMSLARKIALIVLLGLGLGNSQNAFARLRVELMGGSSISLPTLLTIYQENLPKISMTAHYDTRPLTPAFYYAIRFGWWGKDSGWELELVHQKIYLNNPTAEVEDFKVTFGYNLLLINYARKWRGIVFRGGGGAVIVHTSSRIRGLDFSLPDNGVFGGTYDLAGVGGQIAVAYPYYFTERFFANVEAKFTAAFAVVPIAQGVAHTPNLAFHGLFGIGYEFF